MASTEPATAAAAPPTGSVGSAGSASSASAHLERSRNASGASSSVQSMQPLRLKILDEVRTKSIDRTLAPLMQQVTFLVQNQRDIIPLLRRGAGSADIDASAKPLSNEPRIHALKRVGSAVSQAVEQFCTVGEAIAEQNVDIVSRMQSACREARSAGAQIHRLTWCSQAASATANSSSLYNGGLHDTAVNNVLDETVESNEEIQMIAAVHKLLSAITKVLLLADTVVVNQILEAKDRVSASLTHLEGAKDFPDFVRHFNAFGQCMVELAHVTGDRQQDLKNEHDRTLMRCHRAVLERTTALALTTSKAWLRHPTCESARRNRDSVFLQMHHALERIQQVTQYGSEKCCSRASNDGMANSSGNGTAVGERCNCSSSADTLKRCSSSQCIDGPTMFTAFKQFLDLIDLAKASRPSVVANEPRIDNERLYGALTTALESCQDLTDSAYTENEHREEILSSCQRVRRELDCLLRAAQVQAQVSSSEQSQPNQTSSLAGDLITKQPAKQQLQDESEWLTAVDRCAEATRAARDCVYRTILQQADTSMATSLDQRLLPQLRELARRADLAGVNEFSIQFEEYADSLMHLCKLLGHISPVVTLRVTADHCRDSFRQLQSQTLYAAQTLAQMPQSKICAENLNCFLDAWESQVNELSSLVKDVHNQLQIGVGGTSLAGLEQPATASSAAGADPMVYLSLPRPGKHGTMMGLRQQPAPTLASSSRLRTSEKARIARMGLEMRLLSSEMNADLDRWQRFGCLPAGQKTSTTNNDVRFVMHVAVQRSKNMSSMAFSIYLFTCGEGPLKTTHDLFLQAEYFAEEVSKLVTLLSELLSILRPIPLVAKSPRYVEAKRSLDQMPLLCQQLAISLAKACFSRRETFAKVDSVIEQTRNLMNLASKLVAFCFTSSAAAFPSTSEPPPKPAALHAPTDLRHGVAVPASSAAGSSAAVSSAANSSSLSVVTSAAVASCPESSS